LSWDSLVSEVTNWLWVGWSWSDSQQGQNLFFTTMAKLALTPTML